MSDSDSQYPCPYCHKAPLEATATAPYVRGFLVAYQVGTKTFIGCVSCVRNKLFAEAALSIAIGWFSIVAVVLNPFFILYNLLRACFVSANPASVGEKLKQLGLPDQPQAINLQAIGAALAASMILADGQVDEEELRVAETAGDRVFGEFDEAALRMIVEHGKDLPPVTELASILRDVLDQEAKEKVMVYLSEIAMADGEVSAEERQMLQVIGESLGTLQSTNASAE